MHRRQEVCAHRIICTKNKTHHPEQLRSKALQLHASRWQHIPPQVTRWHILQPLPSRASQAQPLLHEKQSYHFVIVAGPKQCPTHMALILS